MTATLQVQVVVFRYLLIAHCPVCQRVVEAQVLWCAQRFSTDNIWAHPLSPEVSLRDEAGGFFWRHSACGTTLVPVSREPFPFDSGLCGGDAA